jgi:ATP-dependent protease ClpP protease subunit
MQNNSASLTPLYYSRLIGEINDKSIVDVLKDIDQLNNNENKKNMILTICSSGGLLYYAQALYDAIKASKKPIVAVASGTCMSAAVMVLQAAHKRVSRSNTIFMVHQSSYWREEHTYIDEMNIISSEWNRSTELFIKQTIEKSKLSKEMFDKIAKPRKYLSAQEAMDNGLLDEVSDKWIENY